MAKAVQLGVVQETLLTPLCARADQFGRPDAIVDDATAARIVSQIDYDFDRIRKFPDTLTGCAIRAAIFDRWISEFLTEHRDTCLVMIGEGLDTTFDRNDDGHAIWFELDFPDVIELRKNFFASNDRRNMIGGSVFDASWIDQVRRCGRSQFLFQAAGVTMYLPEQQVRELFTLLADHFPGCTFLFDTCSTLAKRNSGRWEATVRTTDAVYQWGIDNPESIAQWDTRFDVTDTRYMMEYHRDQWSLKARLGSTLFRSIRQGYQLNRAQLKPVHEFAAES